MLSLSKSKFYELYPDWSKDIYKENNINTNNELKNLFHESDIINHFLRNDTTNCKYSCLPDNFSIDVYKYYNFDLLNLSDNQLIKHYIQSGKMEKRIATIDDFYKVNPNFDRLFYITLYGDLKKFNAHELIKHYLYFGREEKRLTGPNDFYEQNPNFNRSITNTEFLVNYIINNKEPIEKKLKSLQVGYFTEEQFYEKFCDWNYDIYITFNSVNYERKKIRESEVLNKIDDFIYKLNQNPSTLNKIIYSLNTFYLNFSDFDYKKYRSENYEKNMGLSEVETIIYWYKNDYNNLSYNSKNIQTGNDFSKNYNQMFNEFNGQLIHHLNQSFNQQFDQSFIQLTKFDEVLIYVHDEFKLNDGGIVVQYYLGNILDHYGIKTRIYSCKKNIHNLIFNNHYSGDFNLDKTIVIYCEGIIGNPLNAKCVVRWLLSELGKNVPLNRYLTWGKNELVYYFNREKKFETERMKLNVIYKDLPLLYVDSKLLFGSQNKLLLSERENYCFTMRKANIHHKEIKIIHPSNSLEITYNTSFLDAVNIFSKYKYFVSYDPLTFYQIISVLCGCVCIVYPVDGLTKFDWLKQTALWTYMEAHNINDLYGVAYGIEELNYAESTINKAQTQWLNIINYYKGYSIKKIINDFNNFEKQLNTVENNFFIR